MFEHRIAVLLSSHHRFPQPPIVSPTTEDICCGAKGPISGPGQVIHHEKAQTTFGESSQPDFKVDFGNQRFVHPACLASPNLPLPLASRSCLSVSAVCLPLLRLLLQRPGVTACHTDCPLLTLTPTQQRPPPATGPCLDLILSGSNQSDSSAFVLQQTGASTSSRPSPPLCSALCLVWLPYLLL